MSTQRVKNIIGLPVETQHGTPLGKVVDIEIDSTSSTVSHYLVSTVSFVKQLVSQESELRIAPSQVVSISQTKMVVVDLEAGQTIDAGEELGAPKVPGAGAQGGETPKPVDKITRQ